MSIEVRKIKEFNNRSKRTANVPAVEEKRKTARKLKFFVNGEWRETRSGNYMPVTNSSTGGVMAEAPKCTAEEVSAAVEAAAAAFPAWRDTPLSKRVQVMFRFKNRVEGRLDELATLLATEMSKSYTEVLS